MLMRNLICCAVAAVLTSPVLAGLTPIAWQGLDAPQAISVVDGDALGMSAVDYYDYYSASAHTGLEMAGKSQAFLYTYTGDLSLILVHHIENLGGRGTVTMDITGLPTGWSHDVKDDQGNGGLNDTYTTGANSLLAEWEWVNNTDGAVLGLGSLQDLVGKVITITPSNWSGLNDWLLLGDGGATEMALSQQKNLNISVAVPSPGSALLSLTGVVGLLLTRRRA